MDFQARLAKLNRNQRLAVDQIDGPLLVIAGPGTGKTELLSMRAAQILSKTDTLPSSILCLTFTDSGAVNMRQRLNQIIGVDAYKVAIHTFHSFGVEIINQYREFFFNGGEYQPADDLSQHQVLTSLFDKLDWHHPLAGKNGDKYTYLADTLTAISEFKRSGLTAGELRQIVQSNQLAIDQISTDISKLFENRISKQSVPKFASLAEKVANLEQSDLPAGISTYAGTLALSIIHASQEAIDTGKTTSITAWKNAWCEKDVQKNTVLKDAKSTPKLLAAIDLYADYEQSMNEKSLYDYDDMILNVIHAIEHHPDLRANLQERFQFIMVDEFQDTNLAQLRLLFSLTDGDNPNVMAVGDDDQAIFSFQGADIGNIQRFREYYNDPRIIILTDNYRSTKNILSASRNIITQGHDRLENVITDLTKELVPWFEHEHTRVTLKQYPSVIGEQSSVTTDITKLIASGTPPESIAVIARRHHELIDMLPCFNKHHIPVNYERRDNALDHDLIKLLELLADVLVAIKNSEHDEANALLPRLLAHPAFNFARNDILSLSLTAWRNRSLWLENMLNHTAFKSFAQWLIDQSQMMLTETFERQIDWLLGTGEEHEKGGDDDTYHSPLFNYFFSEKVLAHQPDAYLDAMEALRTIRDKLREHFVTNFINLEHFIEFIRLYKQLDRGITVVRHRSDRQIGHVNLMTAHKSKGLEFDHVFIIGAIDSSWGEKVRSRSRLIRYPANLPLQTAGDNYDERLRLFFVAMTRARKTLHMSFSAHDQKGKPTLVASFLSQHPIDSGEEIGSIEQSTEEIRLEWYSKLVEPPNSDLKTILAPTLESYKLSATHLNNFLDVSRGGPQTFLLNNLLRFPQSKSASASFGTAIHTCLQQTHNLFRIEGKLPSAEDIIDNFSKILAKQHLSAADFDTFNDKGKKALTAYLAEKSDSFSKNQVTELNFAGQESTIDGVRLTGALDLTEIDKTNKTIRIIDYKTGKPSRNWIGKTDYEKIKLHKYRQQLMFYQLLVENSRDYSSYQFTGGVLQFVEPELQTGEILALEDSFSDEELADFKKLIDTIWHKIMSLDLPDTSDYEPSYKGMLQFEQDLLANS